MEKEKPPDTHSKDSGSSARGWLAGARQQLTGIRKRQVPRVAVTYTLGLWFFVQICDVMFPLLDLTDAALSGVLLLGIMGLPVSMGLAWAFQVSPNAAERERIDEAGLIRGIEAFVNVFFVVASIMLVGLLLFRLSTMQLDAKSDAMQCAVARVDAPQVYVGTAGYPGGWLLLGVSVAEGTAPIVARSPLCVSMS